MADAAERERQEKIAAARKRVEQRKKGKKKGTKKAEDDNTKDDMKLDEEAEASPGPTETLEHAEASSEKAAEGGEDSEKVDSKSAEKSEDGPQPTLAQQSKARSTSFRAGSVSADSASPFSPDGETAPDIYRKHVAKIEELERENKRLIRETADSEKRWKKAEEELADVREAERHGVTDAHRSQMAKLKSEIASLQRQRAQLQQQVNKNSTHGHRPSISMSSPPSDLQIELDSKSATIESMEIELSKLKARLERQETGVFSGKEQVAALEEKLARSVDAADKAQRELQDLKRHLERTSEKAVREGSERSSAQTRVKTLECELADSNAVRDDLAKRIEGLEKKVATLTTLHKEQDSRTHALRREKEKAEREVKELQDRVEKLDSENIKLRSRRSAEGGGGLDDEGVDELEDEERFKLEKKIRSLEGEIHRLRSGQWIERRREMEGFQDVDLSGGYGAASTHKTQSGGIGDLLSSGLNALAGRDGDDGFLEDVDGGDFDEEAFRKAHEEQAKKRVERIKEVKRSLKHWVGWRLDIVDIRRGGREAVGDIFEV